MPKSCKQSVSFSLYTGKSVRDHDWIRRLFFVSTVFELVLNYLLPSSFCINWNQRDIGCICAAFLTAIRYNGWLLYLRPRLLIIFYWVHQHWTAKIPKKVITKNVSGLACLCQTRSRFIVKKIAITVFFVFSLSISRFFLVFGKIERKQGYDNRDNFSANLISLNHVNIKLN